MAREKIFLAHDIQYCPNFSPDQPSPFLKNINIYFHEDVKIAYDYHYYQMMERVNNFFIQTRSGRKLLVT
jgi:hypothetical protein